MAKTKRATPTGPSLFDLSPAPRISVGEDEAKRTRTETSKKDSDTVTCGDCQHFQRDTSGISRDINGVYFMGVCQRGLHPDTIRKQFADKPRICETFKPKTT